MRFIITAQAGTGEATAGSEAGAEAEAGFNEKLLIDYMKFNEEMYRAGVLVASEGLNPAARGARVAVAGGKRHVVDGPFAESKELVGGFYIVDAKSLEEAIQWALRAPSGMGADDVLEVRQLTGAGDLPPEVLEIIKSAAPTWCASVWQSSEVTTDVLQAFADAWNRHDVDALMSFMTEDCVFESSAGADLCGTRYVGRDAVRAGYAEVWQVFPDAHWGNARHFVHGDRGVSEWTFTGTRADGTCVEVHGCDLFTFRDGKIAVKNSYRKNRPPIAK